MISQKHIHTQLATLPGEYKELFIEKSNTLGLRIVNGRIEPATARETQGASLLLKNGNTRFFEARESLAELDALFESGKHFEAPIGEMRWVPTDTNFEFQDRVMTKDLAQIVNVLTPHVERLGKISWVTSTLVWIGLWDRSYIAVSNRHAGGIDNQYQVRVFIMATAERNGVTQEYYKTFNGLDIVEKITDEKIAQMCDYIESRLNELLEAPESPSGEMDIVIAAESGGDIIHEAVGHGLEGDLQSSSAYADKIGEKVASSKVTIIDDPTISGLRGQYTIDHEWHLATRAVLIENGILKNYLHQESSAEFLGLPQTGHARRETYSHEAMVRMGNTYMAQGTDNPEDIIASVEDGLYVTAMGGGQVNTTSGDFVFKVLHARRIRDGKLAEVVRGANLAGNGPKMLMDVSMVGNDALHFHGGTCGKDGQGMPVTDATPTIKVRLKVTG